MQRASGGVISGEKLPSCFDNLKQHTKRANYQAVMWRGSLECNPTIPVPVGYRWSENKNGIDTVSNQSCPASNEKLYLLPCGCSRKCLLVRTCSKSELVPAQTAVCSIQMVATLSSVKIYAGGLPKQNSARKLSKYGVFSGPYFPHSQ